MLFLDRRKETSTTSGSGSYLLAGASQGYKSFPSGQVYYCAATNTAYEVGIGTVSGGYLSRDTILDSTQNNEKLNWSTGTKTLFLTVPGYWYDRIASGNFEQLTPSGNLVPARNNAFDVGITSSRWRNGWFTGDMIIGGAVYSNGIINTGTISNNGNVYSTSSGIFGKDVITSGTITVGQNITPAYASLILKNATFANFRDNVDSLYGQIGSYGGEFQVSALNGAQLKIDATNGGRITVTGGTISWGANGGLTLPNNLVVNSSGIFGKDIIVSGTYYGSETSAIQFKSRCPLSQPYQYFFNDSSNNVLLQLYSNTYNAKIVGVTPLLGLADQYYGQPVTIWAGNTGTSLVVTNISNQTLMSVKNTAVECNSNLVAFSSGIFGKDVLVSGDAYFGTTGNIINNAGGHLNLLGGNGILAGTAFGTTFATTHQGPTTLNTGWASANHFYANKNVFAIGSGIFNKDVVVSGELYLGDRTYPILTNTGTGGYTSLKGSSNGGVLTLQNGLNPLSWGNHAIHSNTKVYTYDLSSTYLTTYNLVTSNDVIASGNIIAGTVQVPNGYFTTPTLTFSNDTDTGFYLYSANTMMAVAGGKIVAQYDNIAGTNYCTDTTTYLRAYNFHANANIIANSSGIFGKDIVVSGDANLSNGSIVTTGSTVSVTRTTTFTAGLYMATGYGIIANGGLAIRSPAYTLYSEGSGIFGKTIIGSGGATFYGTSYPTSFVGVYPWAYSFNAAVAGPMLVVSDYSATTTVGLGVRNDGVSYLGNGAGTCGVMFSPSDFSVLTKVSAPRVECLNANAGFRFAGRDTASMGFEWFAPTSSVAKLYSYAVSNNVLEVGSNGNLLATGSITASGALIASGSTCSVGWVAQNGAAGAAWYSPTAGNVRLYFNDVGNAPIQFGNNGDIFPTTNGGGSCGKSTNRFVMYGTNGDFSNNVLVASNVVANSSGIFGKDIVVSGELYLGDRTYPTLTNTGTGGYTSLRGSSNGGVLTLQNGLNPLSWGNHAIHSNTKVYTYDLSSTYLTTYNLVTANHVIASGNATAVSGIFTRDVIASGDLKVYGSQVNFSGLPTTDPHDYGRLYRFGSGIFMSLG